MGKIYEEIEVEGKPVKVKIDTGSDFELALRREVIEELKLQKAPFKAKIFREEEGKTREYLEPMWFARTKIRDCEFPTPLKVIEASGESLLGHPILQSLGVKIDEENETFTFDPVMCPKGCRGGITGEIIGEIENGRLSSL